jgi:hypothetical protein
LNDAQAHAQEGCYLEYFRLNDDDADEVLFLFRVDNLDHAKKFINEIQYQVNRLVTFFYKLPHISIW